MSSGEQAGDFSRIDLVAGESNFPFFESLNVESEPPQEPLEPKTVPPEMVTMIEQKINDDEEVPQPIIDLLTAHYGNLDVASLPRPESVAKTQYSTLGNPQFSILELMVITGLCFVTLVAISKIGLIGTILLFLVCCGAFIYLRRTITEPTKYRFWNQVVWGMLMPIACVFGDPLVFGSFENGIPFHFSSYAIACYSFIAWQMLILIGSWFVAPSEQFFNEFATGTFTAAAIFCYIIAVFILPLAAVASLMMGIGLPGFTPLITGNVFRGTARMHRARTERHSILHPTEVTGFVTAVTIGMIGYGVSIFFQSNIKSWLGDRDFFNTF